MLLGSFLGERCGALAGRWLGMGIGGALAVLLASCVHAIVRRGHRVRGWARVASFILLLGTYGYLAAKWGGELGVLFALCVVPFLVYHGVRLTARLVSSFHQKPYNN